MTMREFSGVWTSSYAAYVARMQRRRTGAMILELLLAVSGAVREGVGTGYLTGYSSAAKRAVKWWLHDRI